MLPLQLVLHCAVPSLLHAGVELAHIPHSEAAVRRSLDQLRTETLPMDCKVNFSVGSARSWDSAKFVVEFVAKICARLT